ncbi:MAG TPA: hypothetical protein VIW24_20340 [Aldersonia sp.]
MSPRQVEHALGELDAVDLAACYPVVDAVTGAVSAEVAVTVREAQTLAAESLNSALERIEPGGRPDIVRVVEEMPVTSWYRPSITDRTVERAGQAWRLDSASGAYRAFGRPRSSAVRSAKESAR